MRFSLLNPLLALFFLGASKCRAEPPPNARVRLEPGDLFPSILIVRNRIASIFDLAMNFCVWRILRRPSSLGHTSEGP